MPQLFRIFDDIKYKTTDTFRANCYSALRAIIAQRHEHGYPDDLTTLVNNEYGDCVKKVVANCVGEHQADDILSIITTCARSKLSTTNDNLINTNGSSYSSRYATHLPVGADVNPINPRKRRRACDGAEPSNVRLLESDNDDNWNGNDDASDTDDTSILDDNEDAATVEYPPAGFRHSNSWKLVALGTITLLNTMVTAAMAIKVLNVEPGCITDATSQMLIYGHKLMNATIAWF